MRRNQGKGRVLLISPPFNYFPGNKLGQQILNYSRPPLGLCYLASYLSKYLEQKINIKIIDGMICSEKHLLSAVQAFQPHMIGISAVTANINNAKAIARKIKAFLPDSLFIGGGPHLSVRPQDGFPEFNAVVLGEGEKPFLSIVSKWLEDKNLDGLSFSEGVTHLENGVYQLTANRIDNLDELPFPDRSLLDLDKYYHSYPYRTTTNRFTTIFTSRGCNFNCTFCGSSIIFPGGKRFFSLPYIKQEIEHVVYDHKCSLVFFDDDEFLLQKSRLVDLCEHLIKKKYPLKWICHGRPEGADSEIMRLMKAAGCVEIQVGVESGAEHLLAKMKRGYRIDQVYRFFKIARQEKINTWATFILGYPGETNDTIDATLQLAIKADPTYASFITLLPFPGSCVYKELVAQNCIRTFDWSKYSWHSKEPVFSSPLLASVELIDKRSELLRKFYARPTKIFKLGKAVLASGRITEMTRNFMAWLSLIK